MDEQEVQKGSARDRVLVIFDDYYGSHDNVVGSYLGRIVDQLTDAKSIICFTKEPYRGSIPISWRSKVKFFSCAKTIPKNTGRSVSGWAKATEFLRHERSRYWASTLSDDFEIIARLMFDASHYRAVICFTQSATYALAVARLAHIFSDSETPHLFMVSRRRAAAKKDVEDLNWLGVTCLVDGETFPSIHATQRPNDEFLFVRFGRFFLDRGFRYEALEWIVGKTGISRRVKKGMSNYAMVLHGMPGKQSADVTLAGALSLKTAGEFAFFDGRLFPIHGQRSAAARWDRLLASHLPLPKRIPNIVLYVRPDWDASGSGTVFNSSKAFLRQNDSLLIEVALWPYLVGLKNEEYLSKAASAERQGRPAAAFYLRRSGGLAQHAKAFAAYLSQRPRSLSRQLLLYYMGCAAPRLLRDVLHNARINTVYLNHYFTHGFIAPYIGTRKFFLDAHDIQSANFSYYMYRNPSTAKADSFDDMLKEESEILNKAHRLSFLSLEEYEFAKKVVPAERAIHYLPLPAVRALPRKRAGSVTTFLTVSSNNLPNELAMHWLLDEVWPLVVAKAKKRGLKNFYLKIFGDIKTKFEGRQFPYGEFAGRVENLESEYRKADVVLTPVVSGTGVAIKTVEAILTERPIIATREALRGLSPRLVEIMCHSSTPETFAEAIIEALSSSGNRNVLAKKSSLAAKMLLAEDYGERLRDCLDAVRDEAS